MRKQKNVLLVLGWYDHRLHQGIARYAQEHGWHLSANLARERVIPWGWTGDGVLAWLGAGDDLAEFVESLKRPTVDFSLRRPHLPFARVLQDHDHAARLVAEHFLSRGFKRFLFYSDTDNWSYEERGHGFGAALQKAGHGCTWIKWHESKAYQTGREEWSKRRAWLAVQMKQADKPLAVFAANDQLAVDVLEACGQCGLSVPEQVAIVGAENYLLAVDAMRTPISSVDTNLEEQGYEGAALCGRLMRGEPPPREPVRVPASRVVTRKSSDILAVNHQRVAKGLRFIWEKFREPISVDAVAKAAAMSRRGLHQAFLEHLGRTPGEEIRALRVEHAKKLLAETDYKLEAIAGLSGYQSANSFCIAFKKSAGLSPVGFRKSTRHDR
jgi:LacI family transcriptional regulator